MHNSFLKPEANEGIVDDPERCWELILLLLKASPSRKGLSAVAAGPLRQLMHSYFDQFIDRVRQEARDNLRLSYALAHLHVDSDQHRSELWSLGKRSAVLNFTDESEEERAEEINGLVTDWLLFARASSFNEREAHHWAVSAMHDLPLSDPHKCWSVILKLLERAATKDELLDIGVEIGTLLMFNFEDFANIVAQELPQNSRLAYALQNACLDEEQKAHWVELLALAEQFRLDDPFKSV